LELGEEAFDMKLMSALTYSTNVT